MKLNETFYRSLNRSIEPIDNHEYITETNIFMDAILKEKSSINNLLVLGSGNMNDMSLDFFLQNFKEITLTDIDIVSTEEQINIIKSKQYITLKQVDYLGLTEQSFFDGLKEQLMSAKSQEDVQSIIEDKVTNLLGYNFSSQFSELYDAIYVSPIYTQLLYRQVEMRMRAFVDSGLSEEFSKFALVTLLQEMIRVIDHFNDGVKQVVRQNGLLFVASDIFLVTDDPFSKQIKDNIKAYEAMEEIYTKYQKTYGYGLGDYGLYSLENIMKPLHSSWVMWHQSKHQTYAVKFRAFEKIDD